MMIEPPGNPGRGRVFEVDNGVFVAGEFTLVKERAGSMDEAVVLVGGVRGDAFAMEASKERGRAGSVETFVVIENANLQNRTTPLRRKAEQPELFSIKGTAACVKAGRTQFPIF
jgi:hypothetical protein